jgi:hypothetical protein
MIELPDVKALIQLPFDSRAESTGIRNLYEPQIQRTEFDSLGLWWTVPFATGESGYHYAFRLAPALGHGAVVRCISGHTVTIASTPDRAILAVLAVERLLRGPKSRAILQAGWSQARGLLREAVTITGGDPDRLDEVLHLADELPKWRSPVPVEEEESRRAMLWRITDDTAASSGLEPSIWDRSKESRLAPEDPAACLRLLEGNHGLDGTRTGGGLAPNTNDARSLLVACARRVHEAKLEPDEAWVKVINSIAKREQPKPADFIPASVGVGPLRAWDALAAASFWYMAVEELVPKEQAEVAEQIAEEAGAKHVLQARRLLG